MGDGERRGSRAHAQRAFDAQPNESVLWKSCWSSAGSCSTAGLSLELARIFQYRLYIVK